MGIPLLSSFISNIDGLRKTYKLSNSYLVIDGNNLMHILYQLFNKRNQNDFIFGGNYTDYRKFFHKFFDNLKKCNIKPIMIFDGGLNLQLKDNRMHRFQETFNKTKKLSENPPKDEVLSYGDVVFPFRLKKSMISVCEESNVFVFQTPIDADLDSAKLANQLKCPLLSNDSDFLVMDINEGVITCDSFQWEELKSKSKGFYIKCEIYRIVDFVQKFDLKPEMLPIFGSLMGNDGIKGEIFEDLFRNISNGMTDDLNIEATLMKYDVLK